MRGSPFPLGAELDLADHGIERIHDRIVFLELASSNQPMTVIADSRICISA